MTHFISVNSARKSGTDLIKKIKRRNLIDLKLFEEFDFYKTKVRG